MNFKFDFDDLSPAEIDARCRQIAAQKNALEDNQRRQENDLQQTQARWKQLREQVQMLLERLILALAPDLSGTVKFRLAQIFPHHPELVQDSPTAQTPKGFWQELSAVFSNLLGSAPNPLEETRVLLRNVLWQLHEVPPHAGEFTELFRAFLDAKNDYFAQDRMMNQQEAQANQIVEQVSELSRQLRRCRDWIDGRPDEDEIDNSLIYHQPSDYRPSSETNIIASTPFNDSSRFDSSSETAKASLEASPDSAVQSTDSTPDASFSGFGGGGDFAGGGAGGSWENYS
jgi:uncharacterized membrane protein YgcG